MEEDIAREAGEDFDITLILEAQAAKKRLCPQLLESHFYGCNTTRRLIEEELDVTAECRVCGSKFLNLVLFIYHKNTYCRVSYKDERFDPVRMMCPDPSAHARNPEAVLPRSVEECTEQVKRLYPNYVDPLVANVIQGGFQAGQSSEFNILTHADMRIQRQREQEQHENVSYQPIPSNPNAVMVSYSSTDVDEEDAVETSTEPAVQEPEQVSVDLTQAAAKSNGSGRNGRKQGRRGGGGGRAASAEDKESAERRLGRASRKSACPMQTIVSTEDEETDSSSTSAAAAAKPITVSTNTAVAPVTTASVAPVTTTSVGTTTSTSVGTTTSTSIATTTSKPESAAAAKSIAAATVKLVAAATGRRATAAVSKPMAAGVAKSVTVSSAKAVTTSGAKSVTTGSAKSVTAGSAKSVTAGVAKSVTVSSAKAVTAESAKSVTVSSAKSVTTSGAKSVTTSSAKSVTAGGANSATAGGAKSVTASGAKSASATAAKSYMGLRKKTANGKTARLRASARRTHSTRQVTPARIPSSRRRDGGISRCGKTSVRQSSSEGSAGASAGALSCKAGGQGLLTVQARSDMEVEETTPSVQTSEALCDLPSAPEEASISPARVASATSAGKSLCPASDAMSASAGRALVPQASVATESLPTAQEDASNRLSTAEVVPIASNSPEEKMESDSSAEQVATSSPVPVRLEHNDPSASGSVTETSLAKDSEKMTVDENAPFMDVSKVASSSSSLVSQMSSPAAPDSQPKSASHSHSGFMKTRTSTRKRMVPKRIQECEEEPAKKVPARSRKIACPPGAQASPGRSSVKKPGTLPSSRKPHLDRADGHSYAKSADLTKAGKQAKVPQRLPCFKCHMTFASRKSLTFHVSKKHSGKKLPHHCHLCPKFYQYKWGLHRHLLRTHAFSQEDLRAWKEKPAYNPSVRRAQPAFLLGAKEKVAKLSVVSLADKPGPGRQLQVAATLRAESSPLTQKSGSPAKSSPLGGQDSPSKGKSTQDKIGVDIFTNSPGKQFQSDFMIHVCPNCDNRFGRRASLENHLRFCQSKKLPPGSASKKVPSSCEKTDTESGPRQAGSWGPVGKKGTQGGEASTSSGRKAGGARSKAMKANQITGTQTDDRPKVETPRRVPAPSWSSANVVVTKQCTVDTIGSETDAPVRVGARAGQTRTGEMDSASQSDTCAEPAGSVLGLGTRGTAEKEQTRELLDSQEGASTGADSCLRAVVKRRSGMGRRLPSTMNWSGSGTGEGPVPGMDLSDIVVEPGRKLEIIWVNKQVGMPTERVRSNRIFVKDEVRPNKSQCHVTRDVAEIINEKELVCLNCGQEFSNASNLRRHAVRHLDWKRFKCRKCSFSSYDRSECHTHINRAHPAERKNRPFTSDLIIDLNREAARMREQRGMVVISRHQAKQRKEVEEETTDEEEEVGEREVEKIRRQASSSQEATAGPASLRRATATAAGAAPLPSAPHFNISTRRCPREFDVTPYRPPDPLSTASDCLHGYAKLSTSSSSSDGESEASSDSWTSSSLGSLKDTEAKGGSQQPDGRKSGEGESVERVEGEDRVGGAVLEDARAVQGAGGTGETVYISDESSSEDLPTSGRQDARAVEEFAKLKRKSSTSADMPGDSAKGSGRL